MKQQIDAAAFGEELASAVTEDFEKRRSARRSLENQWRLNLCFLKGRQYADVGAAGNVEEAEGGYYWQSRNVYNHILPVMDTRLAKLARVRPVMNVRSATEDDSDVLAARITARVLNSTWRRLDCDAAIASATEWSEVCGTAFYRVGWNAARGKFLGVKDGAPVFEGDAEVEVVSPFEIFPDSLTRKDVDECESLIRARVVSASEIKEIYGVEVAAEKQPVLSLEGETAEGVMLIEHYRKPCKAFPSGRVVTVAGGKLLAVEEFPYVNGAEGGRVYPFVRQLSHGEPGCFFGRGIIDRLIPVQRAYNAVRNRKQEFLNRLAAGVLTVEDGSVDVDALVEDGLRPGKVIVYRQGCEPPKLLSPGNIPGDFDSEEEKLLEEFVLLGGVNEVSQNYKATLGVTSAAGLRILLEQDDERLTVSAENIRRSVMETARRIIRLFRQFTAGPRLMRIAGEGGKAELFYFNASDLTSDDVVFEAENELTCSPSQRRSIALELIDSGIFEGKVADKNVRDKLLSIMGFEALVGSRSDDALHAARADSENAGLVEPRAANYDDHEIHIGEHTRFLVGGGCNALADPKAAEQRLAAHIERHRAMLAEAENPLNPTKGE